MLYALYGFPILPCERRRRVGGRESGGPCGGQGTPGSAVTPRLARTSCRGGRSSRAAGSRRWALARVSSCRWAGGGVSPLLVRC